MSETSAIPHLGLWRERKQNLLSKDKAVLQLHSQAKLARCTKAVSRLKADQDQGWNLSMGTDESELVPAVNDKYGHAALHRLPVSRGYNRDEGLGGLPLLWFKMELANKQWEGYTGSGKDIQEVGMPVRRHTASNVTLVPQRFASSSCMRVHAERGITHQHTSETATPYLWLKQPPHLEIHTFGTIRNFGLFYGYILLHLFLASPRTFIFLGRQTWPEAFHKFPVSWLGLSQLLTVLYSGLHAQVTWVQHPNSTTWSWT